MLTSTLAGKVAVLTGAGRGIGKAIADCLVHHGVKVVIGDILEEECLALVKKYNKKAGAKVAAFIFTDVTKYIDNINLFKLAEKEFGGVDLALLNAGVALGGNSMFTPLNDELEKKIFDINAIGLIKGTKVALLHMDKRGGGSIVHMASIAGLFSYPDMASYCASKHAVVGYTRSFVLMPSICNVRVNAICPYWVETDILPTVLNAEDDPFGEVMKASPRTPIETVVNAFLTLVIDESINAQVLMALPDGSHFMKPQKEPESLHTKESKEKVDAYSVAAVAHGKRQLAAARERYERSN